MRMSAPLVITAAAAIAVTGCSRTTVGSVALTTEPGPPINRTVSPSLPRLPFPFPLPMPRTPGTTSPGAPGSTDPQSITCGDYLNLDATAQRDVVDSIISSGGSTIPRQNVDLAKSLADALCSILPEAPVSSLLLGGPR